MSSGRAADGHEPLMDSAVSGVAGALCASAVPPGPPAGSSIAQSPAALRAGEPGVERQDHHQGPDHRVVLLGVLVATKCWFVS